LLLLLLLLLGIGTRHGPGLSLHEREHRGVHSDSRSKLDIRNAEARACPDRHAARSKEIPAPDTIRTSRAS
jgi:hypothetical protein